MGKRVVVSNHGMTLEQLRHELKPINDRLDDIVVRVGALEGPVYGSGAPVKMVLSLSEAESREGVPVDGSTERLTALLEGREEPTVNDVGLLLPLTVAAQNRFEILFKLLQKAAGKPD